jgi:hypothetical protein
VLCKHEVVGSIPSGSTIDGGRTAEDGRRRTDGGGRTAEDGRRRTDVAKGDVPSGFNPSDAFLSVSLSARALGVKKAEWAMARIFPPPFLRFSISDIVKRKRIRLPDVGRRKSEDR